MSKYNIPNFLLLWFASYLSNGQQRVGVNTSVSSFRLLKRGNAPGFMCPFAFLVLIDDLSTGCPVHYVDNTTLSELVQPKQLVTHISTYLSYLLTWAAHNGMELNISKIKEMILGQLAVTNLPLLSISSQTTDRVTSLKLLEVHTDSSLSWYIHIDHIIKKTTTGLYFLKQLKRAGLSSSHLYTSFLHNSHTTSTSPSLAHSRGTLSLQPSVTLLTAHVSENFSKHTSLIYYLSFLPYPFL